MQWCFKYLISGALPALLYVSFLLTLRFLLLLFFCQFHISITSTAFLSKAQHIICHGAPARLEVGWPGLPATAVQDSH